MDLESTPRRILVVDDDEHLRKFITRGLSRAGFTPIAADSGSAGIALLREQSFDCVLCDLHMPEVDGLDVLRFSATLSPRPPFIVLTGYGSVSVAVEAMKHGASDFLEKPVSIDELRATIQSILARNAAAAPAPASTAPKIEKAGGSGGLVGSSSWLEPFMTQLELAAKSDLTVLLLGETGTGKSAIAAEIAKRSARSNGPFVEINCATIPDTLMENELFGHIKGAYTNASAGATGKVELADGGTLFLDEIGELKLEMQSKLLTVLQNKTFTPIGSARSKQVDVRFIAATNRDLESDIETGRFRRDLYFRLNVIALEIPPLRNRLDDVPLLIEHFRARIAERRPDSQPPSFSPSALDALCRHRWEGNVRELQNLVERMAAMHPGRMIEPVFLPPHIRDARGPVSAQRQPSRAAPPAPPPDNAAPPAPAIFDPPNPGGPEPQSFKEAVKAYEILMITKALANTGGNQSRAAKMLNMNRTTLIEKMKRLGIEAGDDDDGGSEGGDPPTES